MKNLTIAVDESILAAGRRYAREHHISLNGLIRQLLERAVSAARGASSTQEFFLLADKAKGSSQEHRWKREDLYDV